MIGQKFRVPQFVATSAKRGVAETFARKAQQKKFAPVIWRFEFDSKHGCRNVAIVQSTHVKSEAEWLFVPYSVFQVVSVNWVDKDKLTYKHPHTICLSVAIDNLVEDEHMPLSPWA